MKTNIIWSIFCFRNYFNAVSCCLLCEMTDKQIGGNEKKYKEQGENEG